MFTQGQNPLISLFTWKLENMNNLLLRENTASPNDAEQSSYRVMRKIQIFFFHSAFEGHCEKVRQMHQICSLPQIEVLDSSSTLETNSCSVAGFHLEASVSFKFCSTQKGQSSGNRVGDPQFIPHRPVSMSVERRNTFLQSFPFWFLFSFLEVLFLN